MTSNGLLYSWGCNDDGVLGRIGTDNEPGLVEFPIPVDSISTGDSHAVAALLRKGVVYSWGVYRNTTKGKMNEVQKFPKLLEDSPFANKSIDKIISGFNHTLFLANKRVYAMGDPETFVLGRMPGARRRLEGGLKIEALNLKNVADIYTGGNHSFCKVLKKGN